MFCHSFFVIRCGLNAVDVYLHPLFCSKALSLARLNLARPITAWHIPISAHLQPVSEVPRKKMALLSSNGIYKHWYIYAPIPNYPHHRPKMAVRGRKKLALVAPTGAGPAGTGITPTGQRHWKTKSHGGQLFWVWTLIVVWNRGNQSGFLSRGEVVGRKLILTVGLTTLMSAMCLARCIKEPNLGFKRGSTSAIWQVESNNAESQGYCVWWDVFLAVLYLISHDKLGELSLLPYWLRPAFAIPYE